MGSKFRVIEVKESKTNSSFGIAPERGGIMTSLVIEGRELLFMNQATFEDKNTNIRGGNPILFPISGQLVQGEYEWNGSKYRMNSHGVVRDMVWEVVDSLEGEREGRESSITLKVKSTPETKQSYPFDFELIFTYSLKNSLLTIQQEYRNTGDSDMPMYPGFHPYFLCNNLKIEYKTEVTTMTDGKGGQLQPFTGTVDLTGNEGTVCLNGPESGTITFRPIAEERPVTMTYGPGFKYTMLWTIQGQPFICVEPWMAKSEEIYRQKELVWVKSGESLHTFLSIGLEP